MLKILKSMFLPLEILVSVLVDQHMSKSYCVTVVSEMALNINLTVSFSYIVPTEDKSLESKLLDVADMGCSDYIVELNNIEEFLFAYRNTTLIQKTRRSDKKFVFITDYEKVEKILMMNEIKYMPNMLIVVPRAGSLLKSETFDLMTQRFVGRKEDSQNPIFVDTWNLSGFMHNANLFPHDLSNLHGKTLTLAAIHYEPYAFFELDTRENPKGYDGLEIKVIEEFCRWVNCTIEIRREDKGQWGNIYENNTGYGILGSIVEDKTDFGIGALFSWSDIYRTLDFSSPTINSHVTCLVPAARQLENWELPFMPFSLTMWGALSFTFVFASLAFGLSKGCKFNKVFLTTFGVMITQSQSNLGSTWRIRSITGWLLITGLVLDNAYGSGLASALTVPMFEEAIETIQDIVDRKMEWGGIHEALAFSLINSDAPLIINLLKQFRVYPSQELVSRSFQRNMAFALEKLQAGTYSIPSFINKEGIKNLQIMKENFSFEYCVVMMRKSSPYTQKMSDLLGRLHSSGLLLGWETQMEKYLNREMQLHLKLSSSKRNQIVTAEPLNLWRLQGIFYLYCFGVLLSLLSFICEVILKKI